MTSKRTRKNPPSYRLHKPSGRGIVTLNGHTYYLTGKYKSSESRAEYDARVTPIFLLRLWVLLLICFNKGAALLLTM